MAKGKKIVDDKDDPTLIPSDPEDDDFVAGSEDEGSSSDSDKDDQDGSDRPAKRQKVEAESMSKDALDDLWASFNSDAAGASTTPATTTKAKGSSEKVTVVYRFEFAGETVLEEKQVDADSDEAKEYKRTGKPLAARLPNKKAKAAATPAPPTASSSADAVSRLFDGVPEEEAQAATGDSSAPTPAEASAKPTTTTTAKRKAGGGGGLAAMAASLGGKATKLTTLEKSKMDWNKYVAKQDLGDTLAAARKDGYLDKQDFLKRTEEKKEEDWEKAKSTRRR